MFKLESYITPILLSYVNKYVTNFRTEDSQVSFWGGDAVFNNLELNLQVLEQELHLPFSFVSGSIRELLIHVPWTKLASEPITITINTIECIFNLRGNGDKGRSENPPPSTEKHRESKEIEAPQGYVQLLINKIVSNICIYCNNLILKYVEEDIVLSMNVKHLKFESADSKWEPAYIDISPAEVILRKVITINDLTLCLDKRNASGKIEIYMEPMLYKCSMTMHLFKNYHSACAGRASITRFDIFCNKMEFSMTEQQVPMFMRLLMLIYALKQKQLGSDNLPTEETTNASREPRGSDDSQASWGSWAWSYVSSVLPAPWDDELEQEELDGFKGHTVHFGSYIDNLSITFKVSEANADRSSYYNNHKKMRYNAILCLQLQGLYCEAIIHGMKWCNAMGGVSQAILLPIGPCSCSYLEVPEDSGSINYLKIGSETSSHKSDSLFDAEAVENNGKRRQYNTSSDHHMTVNTESVLLERTPAFAFDYLYQMEIPSDTSSEVLSEMGSDYEFSNFMENANMRMCIGPFKLRLCSGLFHRLGSVQAAATYYDYQPYTSPKPEKTLQDIHPPSEEDFDALSDFIPTRSMRITFFAPIIELELMDHPYFRPTKGNLFKRRQKMALSAAAPNPSSASLPKLTLECQFLDISSISPMYVNRLVHTTCQLPDPPPKLFNACYARQHIKVVGLCSRLILNAHRNTTILTPSSLSYTTRSIAKPEFWINPDIPHEEQTFESETITLNGTNAKMMVVALILGKMMKMDAEGGIKVMNCTSILSDASKDNSLPFMELCIEFIRFKSVKTNSTVCLDMSLGSIKGFIFEPIHRKSDTNLHNDIQQILFISGPDPKPSDLIKTESPDCSCKEEPSDKTVHLENQPQPLFTAIFQFPLAPERQSHPPILFFNLQEIRICIDPMLCRWLLYSPKQRGLKQYSLDNILKNRSFSEASGSIAENTRKISSQIESVHSSSDRDILYIPQKIEVTQEETVDLQEKTYNILKKWFDVWKGMFICGDVSQCTIYFPLVSLSAIGSQGIQEAVESAVNKEHPPDIMIITLPFANIRSAHRQSIKKYLHVLPVSLPDTIWSPDKLSFPWTMSISDMSCYTIQFGNKLIFLKPVSLSATVGLSTRPIKESDKSADCPKPDIGSLGICVHIDMTPILISTSEVQVYLFASILYGLMEVAKNLTPEQSNETLKTPDAMPLIGKNSSTMSLTEHVIREKSLDSVSDHTPPISSLNKENVVDDSVKLTAWVQWTITRFTIELLSNDYGLSDDLESLQPRLKLVVDAEDIVSSLDFQSIYLKIKSKIGSASIQHYKRTTPNANWKAGPFSGIVMRLREDVASGQRHEDSGFVSITITRASCQHTHTLWGAVQKRYNTEPKRNNRVNPQLLSQSRYITEIVVNIQPIDFIISLKTLRSFYLVVVPLLQIPVKSEHKISDNSSTFLNFNNQKLPLAYLECQDIRVIIPSVELGGSKALQDAVVFQIQKICLTPSAVNPICRTQLRPDIYEQAAHSRILNIPGSDVEDRQYELDLLGISICTSTWDDIHSVFLHSSGVRSSLKGVSENPALEWNSIEQGQPNINQPMLNLWHITEKFDILVIMAPAMVYKETTVICGHSVEVNFVTDIIINLSLQQIKLVSCLLSEFVALVEPLVLDDNVLRPKIRLPYSKFENIPYEFDETENLETCKDSGIETSDMKSVLSSKILKTLTESEKHTVYTRQPHPLSSSYSNIPFDMLVTAGKIGLGLYQVDLDDKNRKYLRRLSRRSSGGLQKKCTKTCDDLGYEAEEEEEEGVEVNEGKKYVPLVYISVSQPNAFVSKQHLTRKIQVSCFNLNFKLGGPEYSPIGDIPSEEDYPVCLLETRSGCPAPNTGIFPAFFTIRYSKALTKNATLHIEISKPTKILCSTSKWGFLLATKDKVLDNFKGNKKDLVLESESVEKLEGMPSLPATVYNRSKAGDSNSKFLEIKDAFNGINTINVKFDQIVFCIKSDVGHEIQVSMEKVINNISLSTRPEKLSTKTSFHCVTLTVISGKYRKLLLNPWTVSFDVSLFWEPWQSPDSDPQVQINIESDTVVVDVSPEQLKCVDIVIKEINEFVSTLPFNEGCKEDPTMQPLSRKVSDKDQHYKDDLRAGAFQFVDANSENTEELPLPYQVMFWNKNISAMAWRYPQPRALTKVRVFPVPYKMTLGSQSQDDLQVLCHLEYWSDCRNCYLPFTQFYMSESEVCHLTLPNANPQPTVASTWRVVITMVNNSEDQTSSTSNNTNNSIQISPRALAACMRIDSYFNRSLIPSITAALYISKIDISLYNYFDKNTDLKIPSFLKNYTPDNVFPENQRFLTLTWYNITGYLLSWNVDVVSAEINSALKCNVLDYNFLTEQPFVEPFTCKIEVNLSDTFNCNFISKPIHVKFGPNIAHTLAVSTQVWDQAYQTGCNEEKDFIIMTRLIICNDTSVGLRFGQSNTDEEIVLPSRHFHLYSWRSQKKKQQLKIAVDQNNVVWSKPFTIFNDGMELIEFKTDHQISVFVSIKALSATQKKITIFGQLIVANMLMEHFEMKIVEAVAENKEAEFRNTPTELIPSYNSTPSIILNNKKKYHLRLRFYGLDSAWTGDIPLKAHHTGSQPWLVKVPLQERGQFLSIWCRIVTQEIDEMKRILAVLWPLFTVRSSLPISSQVHIETPTLNVHLDSIVDGRGRIQQLYCPGTIDHSHQLTFKMENQNSTSNPYVPLNYSLVDQESFFKKYENGDIEENLAVLDKFTEVTWPFFKDELDDIDWIVEDQPLTHVQVRYQNACPNSCSLLVELLPWCLTVNTLGVPISLMLNGTELCRIPHHGIVAPPKLEENFNLGISVGGSWYYSEPLQLAKSDWSQAFYMPTISGTLPIDGFIKTAIICDTHICSTSIMSSVSNEIRLLRVSSTHVLTNQIWTQLNVICLAIPEGDSKFDFPANAERYSFTLAPCLDKSQSGTSIIKWHTLGKPLDSTADYALYFSFCTDAKFGWSCPIRVDKPFLKRTFCINGSCHPFAVVLTCQEHKGQIFLSLLSDNYPQMLIANKTGTTLLCGQSIQDGVVAEESTHFNWHCKIRDGQEKYYNMPLLSEKFPELPQYHFPEQLSLSRDPGTFNDCQWSQAINITHNYEQYVRIPSYGDIKVVIVNTACTTFVTLQSASQMEINASDIRIRLCMNENDQKSINGCQDSISEKALSASPLVLSRAISECSIPDINKRRGSTVKKYFQLPEPCNDETCMSKGHWSKSNLSLTSPLRKSMLVNTVPMKEQWSCLKFKIFIRNFSVIFISELKTDGWERWEVASLVCDNILIDGTQTEKMKIKFSISDIQFDNQLYTRESYDFPVLLVGQEAKESKKMSILNMPLDILIENSEENAILSVDFTLETWTDKSRSTNITGMKSLKIDINPIALYIEDTYVSCLVEYFNVFAPTNLILWQKRRNVLKLVGTSSSVFVPDFILWQCAMLSRPLTIRSLSISPISLSLSVHYSVKVYLALDQSPLQFGKLERRRLFTTPYRLGHALTMHYLSDAIFGAGWVVSSLELLGSPGGLARAMGTGLRDFVSLPYRGFIIGPMAFLIGITQGSASLMKHITAGTLQSVTKFSSSVARNLDRLSLDDEHLKRAEEQRRQKPQGLAQGFMQGLTGLGISLLGAIGGVAHHPLQSMIAEGVSPISLVTGVGLGLVGMVTKPLSGAAELISLTGQGLLQGAGWTNLPESRSLPSIDKIQQNANSSLKYLWKNLQSISPHLLYICEATCISSTSQYEAVALILTKEILIIINLDHDATQKVISLSELTVCPSNDPTLLVFKLIPPLTEVVKTEEEFVEMDPDSRARVADYVKSTSGFINLQHPVDSSEHSDFDISPLSSPGANDDILEESTVLTYYVNLQSRNYFLCLLELAQKHRKSYSFPVL